MQRTKTAVQRLHHCTAVFVCAPAVVAIFSMSISELENLCSAAIAAMDAGNWDTAILKLMAIKTRRAIMPNITQTGSGGGSRGISWTASEIDSLISECRKQKTSSAMASGGRIKTSRIVYERPSL